MKVGLGVRGFGRVAKILQTGLGAESVVECDASDILAVARQVDVLVPIMTNVPDEALTSGRLKLVQQYGVGLEVVDIDAATAAGVLVANVPSAGSGNAESVAELAICLMMVLGRQLPAAMQRFKERRFSGPMGRALLGSTVLILGFGGIGRAVAQRLAGFGVRIIAVSRKGPAAAGDPGHAPHVDLHVGVNDLHEVIGEADYLVVTAPASPENIGLVSGKLLGAIKPGAFLVNIARGPVVDYSALLEALRDGRLAGAGLDVFWQEPFDPNDPLLQYNVIATPHIGGVTEESLRGIGAVAVENIKRLARGEMPYNCANPEAWPRVKARL